MENKVLDGPSVGSTRKKYRSPKKKQKNVETRERNSPQSDVGKGSNEVFKSDVETSGLPGGSKTATAEKKNGGQRGVPNSRKNNTEAPKKQNSNRAQRPQQPLQLHEDQERLMKWYNYFQKETNILITMDRNHILTLRRADRAKPQAQFVCVLCNYFCDNLTVVGSHINSTQHVKNIKDEVAETTLRRTPMLTQDQMKVLNNFLLDQVAVCGMNPSHLETRRTISVLISDLITSRLKGCSTRLFGSSLHGMGLNTADVNIDLQVPEGSVPSAMLKEVAELLSTSPHFRNVTEHFDSEFPYVSLEFKGSNDRCSVSLNNERAVNLAILLSKYTPLDPRVIQLASLFRLWGQVTKTDKTENGTWPGYIFYLMTIFYLQHCHTPVLPVLNDLLPDKGDAGRANCTKVLYLTVSEIKRQWKTKNQNSLASLWLGLLKFYTMDFNYSDYTISIDSSTLIPCKTRKIFIVDPFLPTRNIARSIATSGMFSYMMRCLRTTCLYFCIPQTRFGPLYNSIYDTVLLQHYADLDQILITHSLINSQIIQLIVQIDPLFSQPNIGVEKAIDKVIQLMHQHRYSPSIDNIPVSFLDQRGLPIRTQYKDMSVTYKDALLLVSTLSPHAVVYNFSLDNLTGGHKIPLVCGVCKTHGHIAIDCPEEKLPPLEPITIPLPQEVIQILDTICYYIYDKWKQSEEDVKIREEICKEIETFIQVVHYTATLQLYGSTRNGFGLKGSDMDICLTFTDNKTGQGLDARGFIEVLYRILKTYPKVQDLFSIATAKVPIVKFIHRDTKLEGDISLYNVLALENSKLLYIYSKIDKRAAILGYMMKRFSKVCQIGDASKGSLSSYAYTLMVIYFLQRCEPPILPVLQELTETGECPKHIVEGCNAYFFHDLDKLDQVWPGRGRNTLSAGQLWLNLLIYYTEQFDMKNNVVAIRCSQTLTKFEKLWVSKGIAIEDPFDLNHNLGSALTRKMTLYIIKTLRKGRNFFGRPVVCSLTSNQDIEEFYFNEKDLTDGDPPNDRGCRFCKSIRHKIKDCPEKKKARKQNRKTGGAGRKEEASKTPLIEPLSDEDEDDYDDDIGPDKEKVAVEKEFNGATKNSKKVGQPSPSFVKHIQTAQKTPTPKVKSTERLFAQKPVPSGNQPPIPTIVLYNSNVQLETSRAPTNAGRFPLNPTSLRPPPGFIPRHQNGQQFIHPVPVAPNSWNLKGMPLYAAAPGGEVVRPSLVNNPHFTHGGMLAPAEQIIWGQAPALTPTTSLESAVAQLHLNKSVPEVNPQ